MFTWINDHFSLIVYWTEWAVRLVMLAYVPQRRTPAAARTWLLFIFLLPVPGVVLYALFGRAYLPRRRLEMQSRVSKFLQRGEFPRFVREAEHELPDRFRETAKLAERLGDFPVVAGNHVELLPEYDPALDRLVADIDAASEHVQLLYYIFGDDAVGRRVADSLVAAKERGVECLLLVDAQGSRAARKSLAPQLREAGIEVRELMPVGLFQKHRARYDLRNHRKIAVIDGRTAYVGSQNLVDSKFKPGLEFEELVARITGPVVRQFQAILLADRFYETAQVPANVATLFRDPTVAGAIVAQALPSGPGYPQANTLRLATALVYAAQSRVAITTPYFIPDETLLTALCTAAQRGVEVRLIVSKEIDQWLVGFAQRSFYEQLLEAGVHVHLYREHFLHAKHLSIDDCVVQIGSSNMDIRSFALNAEVMLTAYDSGLAMQLRAIQERYLKHSEELMLDAWRTRPSYVKMAENMARLVDSLL